jgi:ribonuclease Z
VARITDGQKISYITDASPTEENIERAASIAYGSTSLYCEAFFMSHETQRASERNHLTSAETAKIALKSAAVELIPIHFSAKYKGLESNPGQEALELFKQDQGPS